MIDAPVGYGSGVTDVRPTPRRLAPDDEPRELWTIRSNGPTLTVNVGTDLDVELAYELRDRVLSVVRSRRPQVVVLDLETVHIVDAGAARAVAALLTMLEHRDVEAQLRAPATPAN
jgi:anti-anti-sigma regulatory factor